MRSAPENVPLLRDTFTSAPSPAGNEGSAAEPEPAGHATKAAAATLHVCVTCKSEDGRVGAALFAALDKAAGETGVALRAVECFAVCKRPCTVALASPGKWTYVVGDLNPEAHIEDILAAARRYAASPDGIVPWRDRPHPFRKGVISRTPPLALSPPD
ncbi:MAG TPA: DUF1636 domain-containing protein [Roseiarcus sp.]|nr:DUF1636 domain-containing protein [Roseiarcus sp.]